MTARRGWVVIGRVAKGARIPQKWGHVASLPLSRETSAARRFRGNFTVHDVRPSAQTLCTMPHRERGHAASTHEETTRDRATTGESGRPHYTHDRADRRGRRQRTPAPAVWHAHALRDASTRACHHTATARDLATTKGSGTSPAVQGGRPEATSRPPPPPCPRRHDTRRTTPSPSPPLPEAARPRGRRQGRATRRPIDLAHHLPSSPPPPRAITAIFITLAAATTGDLAGSPGCGFDRPARPGGRGRGSVEPASPMPSMLATPLPTRWGASLNTAARYRGQAPACPNTRIGLRVRQLLIPSLPPEPRRVHGLSRHKRTKRIQSTINTTRVWFNSRSIKYIDHRLSWQVEGSAGNYA